MQFCIRGPAAQQDNMTKPGMTGGSTEKGSMDKGSMNSGTTGMNDGMKKTVCPAAPCRRTA
jgi:hypothetical protein